MSTQTQPYQQIVSGATIYLAPVGESFPDVDNVPSGNWAKLGQTGQNDYSEDGITFNHSKTVNYYRSLGSTGPVKSNISEEDVSVEGTLLDMTLAEYNKVLNGNAVSTGTTSGGQNFEESDIRQGFTSKEYAMLIRTASPNGADKTRQIEIPRVTPAGEPSPVYTKDSRAALDFSFQALEDQNAASDSEKFGRTVDEN